MNFLKVAVTTSFIACLIFTVTVLIMNGRGVEVSDTLIQWFYTVFGVEFASTAAIQITRYQIKKQQIKDHIQDLKDNELPVEKDDLSAGGSDDYEEIYDDSSTYG